MDLVVHVWQQIKGRAFAQCGQCWFAGVNAAKQAGLAKASPSGEYPAVKQSLGLAGVNGRETARQLLGERSPAGIQADKMRRKNQHRGIARQGLDRAHELQSLAHPFRCCMPKPAAVQPGLGKTNKAAAVQVRQLGRRQGRKTQAQVDPGHPTPAYCQRIQA